MDMNIRAYALPILIAFCVAAVFGLYMPMASHAGHEAPCPFAPGGTALCAAPFAHLEHWQSAFVAVFVEVFVLFVLAVVFFSRYDLFDPDVRRYPTYRILNRIPMRPSLFQELFSQGILNRKAP